MKSKDKTRAQKSIQASVSIFFFPFCSLLFENVLKLPPKAIYCTESLCNVIHNVLMIILHFALSGTPPSSECKGMWQNILICKSAADVTRQLCGPMICTFVRRDTWSQLMGSGDPSALSSPVSIILEEEEKMLSSVRPSPSLLTAPRLLSF